MAKTHGVLNKKYPDLIDLFAKKEEARRKRADRPPEEKFESVKKQRELQLQLKSAKVIKKAGVEKD